MKRSILAAIAGIFAAMIIFIVVEQLVHLIYPFPQGLDLQNTAQVNQHLESLPILYWLLVILGWILGSALAGALIKRISHSASMVPPLIVGTILTLVSLVNVISFQHPTWFVIVSLMVFFASVFAGHRLVKTVKQESEISHGREN
jgi:hypothetical protein